MPLTGTPWQPEFGGWAFNLKRGQACLNKWNLIPEDTDVLITHTPPLGFGDLTSTGVRAGCVDLLHCVQQRIKPKYHVYGHIHEGEELFENMTVTNVDCFAHLKVTGFGLTVRSSSLTPPHATSITVRVTPPWCLMSPSLMDTPGPGNDDTLPCHCIRHWTLSNNISCILSFNYPRAQLEFIKVQPQNVSLIPENPGRLSDKCRRNDEDCIPGVRLSQTLAASSLSSQCQYTTD